MGRREDTVRRRLERERATVMERLQRMRQSRDVEEAAVSGGADTVLEEGDAAQVSEWRDMAFTSHERLSRRAAQLTAALERVATGTYGRCRVCDRPIEPPRMLAVPEVETCLACQERLERSGQAGEAA